ncbi:hypothetical protein OS493_005541 [Desmophyllum pertusum]|uniref:Apple domain-containing protein n=1 Tax=Desmophyllum pertusum TaxID=174260 RepID=A0A9W9YTT8_9CNID|nr:hypothetical protein OS493_005541 [Desmophyllum pertusum]
MNIFACLLIFIPFSTAETTKQFEATFTSNGKLLLYLDGERVVLNNTLNYTVNINPGTEVLLVQCRNSRKQPWIIGSASNGLVTDTRWKCRSFPKHEKPGKVAHWSKLDTDDTHWAQAVAKSPHEKIPDVREEALWISTADESHSRLFCRRMLSDLSPRRVQNPFLNGIFQTTIDDVDHALLRDRPRSQHEVGDVMQCFKKCQGDSQCHSFNFEHDSGLPTRKCELNGATKGQDPVNYVRRPGYTYYENVE